MAAVIAVSRGASASTPRAGVLLPALSSSASRLRCDAPGPVRGTVTRPGGGSRSGTTDDGCLQGILAT